MFIVKNEKRQAKVVARKSGSLFFVEYTFSAGKYEPLAAHSHSEYQIGLAVDTCGKYVYQGSRLTAPPMTLNVIHSGAVHKPAKDEFVENLCYYRILYIAPEVLTENAREIGWRKNSELPYFSEFVIDDSRLIREYLGFFNCADGEMNLAIEIRQMSFLTALVGYFSQAKNSLKKLKSAQRRLITGCYLLNLFI